MVYIPNTGTCRSENYPFWTLGTQWYSPESFRKFGNEKTSLKSKKYVEIIRNLMS